MRVCVGPLLLELKTLPPEAYRGPGICPFRKSASPDDSSFRGGVFSPVFPPALPPLLAFPAGLSGLPLDAARSFPVPASPPLLVRCPVPGLPAEALRPAPEPYAWSGEGAFRYGSGAFPGVSSGLPARTPGRFLVSPGGRCGIGGFSCDKDIIISGKHGLPLHIIRVFSFPGA